MTTLAAMAVKERLLEVWMFCALMLITALSSAGDVDLHPREAAILDVLEAKDPQLVEDLLTLRASDPGLYRQKLGYFARELKKKDQRAELGADPALQKLQTELRQQEDQLKAVFENYRQAEDGAARAELEVELRTMARVLFELKVDLTLSNLAQPI
jgi:hypothetical protein